MKFKGTKGKWEAVANGCVWEIVVCDINKKSICAVNNALKEVNDNAVLISKSPEMLELLQEFVQMHRDYDMQPEDKLWEYADKVSELIKEITEI